MATEAIWGGTVGAAPLPVVTGLDGTMSKFYGDAVLENKPKLHPELIWPGPLPAAWGRLTATLPSGVVIVTGQVAKALAALVHAGAAGVTALEVSSWAFRLGAYIHNLRRDYGLAIETVREPHDGGWHGRYVLHSPVVIAEPTP